MRIDLDTYREILDTLTRNKSRSVLTGFGVFWGVFMLVALLGGGRGLRHLLESDFEGFATNSAMVWAQQTTKAYKGFRKGRSWSMTTADVERLRRRVPELDVVTPVLYGWSKQAVRKNQQFSATTLGVRPDMARVSAPRMFYGRYINEMDVSARRKVCVLGRQVYKALFPEGGDPCGQMVRLDSVYYEVVGVDYRSGSGMNFGGPTDRSVTLPISVLQQAYNRGISVDMIAMTARPGVSMSALTPRIRQTVARPHLVDETDEQGVTVFNTEQLFSMMDSLFRGVNILVWLVGTGTLLAGAIGVSNIMMVTVRERTSEIGIRRAIGATPRAILSQIVAESVALTVVAGMSGILLAVAVLQLVELGVAAGGEQAARFQVDFQTAVAAAALIALLGVTAGMPPAWRAMRIKPVEAMREE